MSNKPLPIGVDDFRKIIESGYYFVDKSLLIKDLIDSGSECTLLPRPRRFGKTLNLSMLRHFFEITGEDTSSLFRQLAIWHQGDKYTREQGKYPVIFVTFKDVKSTTWDPCSRKLQNVVRSEFNRHYYLLESAALNPHEKQEFQKILSGSATEDRYEDGFKQLSLWLERYHHCKAIVLIDEYDTPTQEGYLHGYYDKVTGFMRNLLGAVLKGNESLEKAVLTGIMQVSKESLFSGLNNLKVRSILEPLFSAHFGFLEQEVEAMLRDYQIEAKMEEIRSWYNGYLFGNHVIYNPWSILNYVDNWSMGTLPYWVNTSGNELIRQLLIHSDSQVKKDLEDLLAGKSIEKEVSGHLVFGEIEQKPDAIWSFLLLSGYLTVRSLTVTKSGSLSGSLAIPNKEVGTVYRSIFLDWFRLSLVGQKHRELLETLTLGDTDTFQSLFAEYVEKAFSYLDSGGDEPENVYHSFTLGQLVSLWDTYEVRSNRESGYGRYEVMLIPRKAGGKGIVIEFKKVAGDRGETLKSAVDAALKQIEDKRYAAELQDRGVQDILSLGIAIDGKRVKVIAATN